MTAYEFTKITDILDDLDAIERERCDKHLSLNPGDTRRLSDAQHYQQAIADVRRTLRKAFQAQQQV